MKLTARSRLETYASLSRTQSDEKTYGLRMEPSVLASGDSDGAGGDGAGGSDMDAVEHDARKGRMEMISHARRCGYAWIKAAKDRGIDINADKDGYLAVISGLIDELESDATRCPNCENLRLERNEYALWRKDLADKLDEVERHRDALAVALNKLEGPFRLLIAACNRLSAEAEEYQFDDGMGRGAHLDYWHEFDQALERATEALKDEA